MLLLLNSLTFGSYQIAFMVAQTKDMYVSASSFFPTQSSKIAHHSPLDGNTKTSSPRICLTLFHLVTTLKKPLLSFPSMWLQKQLFEELGTLSWANMSWICHQAENNFHVTKECLSSTELPQTKFCHLTSLHSSHSFVCFLCSEFAIGSRHSYGWILIHSIIYKT